MTLRGSIGSPLSALAQHFVVCLGQHCCINDTFPPSKCGSSCCADIICDEVTDNYMVSKQSVVSEGITMALVYSLLVSNANPWTLLYCWTLQRHGIYLTFLDDFPLIRKALEGCYVQWFQIKILDVKQKTRKRTPAIQLRVENVPISYKAALWTVGGSWKTHAGFTQIILMQTFRTIINKSNKFCLVF